MDLGTWLDTWLSLYIMGGSLAPSTKAMYRRAVQAVPPDLRGVQLTSLSALDLLPWLLKVAKTHPRAAQLDRIMLSRALKVAAKLQLCRPDLVDRDTVPELPHTAAKAAVLTAEEASRYLEAARSSPAFVLLALCLCGLRRGEALGVRRQDIDFKAQTVAIVGQRIRIDGEYLYTKPKSRTSVRTLRLPAWLVEAIAAQPATVGGWIVDTTPERLAAAHKATLKRAGIRVPVTLHGLRHTFATLSAASGIPMKQLQQAMGHAKFQLTADTYADHLPPVSETATRLWKEHDWKSCVGLYPT